MLASLAIASTMPSEESLEPSALPSLVAGGARVRRTCRNCLRFNCGSGIFYQANQSSLRSSSACLFGCVARDEFPTVKLIHVSRNSCKLFLEGKIIRSPLSLSHLRFRGLLRVDPSDTCFNSFAFTCIVLETNNSCKSAPLNYFTRQNRAC